MNTAFIVAGVLVTASFAAIGLARGWRREVWSRAALILLGFGWWELRARRLARPTQRGKPPTRAPRRASRRKPPRSRPAS